MSKPILMLPCKYTLSDFEQRDGAHHCKACSHSLIDFRNATDEELHAALQAAGNKTCGIFRPDQVGAKTSVIQLGLQRQIGLSLLGILGLTAPMVTSCEKQQPVEKDIAAEKNAFGKLKFPLRMKGKLIDRTTGLPLPSSEIRMMQNGLQVLAWKTDADGSFDVELKEGQLNDAHFHLVLERMGYINDTIRAVDTWAADKQQQMQLTLQAIPAPDPEPIYDDPERFDWTTCIPMALGNVSYAPPPDPPLFVPNDEVKIFPEKW